MAWTLLIPAISVLLPLLGAWGASEESEQQQVKRL